MYPHRTPNSCQANAVTVPLGAFFGMHAQDGALFQPPQTEGIQSSREACPWHGAYLILPLQAKLTG